MQDGRAIYLLFGLEIESKIHYAMPARSMLYDAINYANQIQKIAAKHSENPNKNITSDEFLSDFWKEDFLIPVITLTLNMSGKPWDGAIDLHEMFNTNDPRILNLVPNYPLNLLFPDKISDEDFCKFKTGVGQLMQFIKHKNDHNMEWIMEGKRFEHVDRETADLIQTVTGSQMNFQPNEEEVNVCRAWANSMNEAIMGEKFETARRLLAKNYSLDIVQDVTQLTLDQIKSCVKKVNKRKLWEISTDEAKLEEKFETAKRLLAKNCSLDFIKDATQLTLDQIKSCIM